MTAENQPIKLFSLTFWFYYFGTFICMHTKFMKEDFQSGTQLAESSKMQTLPNAFFG